MNNLPFLVALHSVDGLGPIRLKKIIEYYKDPKIAWEKTSAPELQKLGIPKPTTSLFEETRKTLDPELEFEKLQKSGIKIKVIFDDDYPFRLREIYDPPVVLYYRGEFSELDDRAIGVVGTRKITGYGRTVTEKFASELSEAGFTIVSGLARGVDTASHWAAIKSEGRTIACLGGGVNKIFPSENINLASQISNGRGVVCSEYPPEYPSLSGNFPARNRVIAGLSIAILVTEAAEDSGSLITANLALNEGREVYAIPGPITSSLSEGPSALIKKGAKLVTSVNDILDDLGMEKKQNLELRMSNMQNLSELEKRILMQIQEEEKHIDELSRNLKKPSFEISAALIKMEISGLIKNLGGGNYIRAI